MTSPLKPSNPNGRLNIIGLLCICCALLLRVLSFVVSHAACKTLCSKVVVLDFSMTLQSALMFQQLLDFCRQSVHPMWLFSSLCYYSTLVWERSIAISFSVCLSTSRSPVAVAQSSSGGIAISYVLPVLWMTSRLAAMCCMAMRGRLNL